ncbi:sensor domain-containing diguanylate cyclase [Sulfurimonas sp. SAG-AH-194-C21]|nr:sensor domain-containing diguanylate cyclase [Sulfurimonas sp. SAG-AH-194-C21]MDF1884021.1 sensor domain-containing diguanylate cyclase [Sulfurimonas sp. SAG-AH-194-C21]
MNKLDHIEELKRLNEIKRLHELFELASDNAGIGIFYYDVIEHPGFFYAQDKVMELLGMKIREDKLYTDDVWIKFMQSLDDKLLVQEIFEQFTQTWAGKNKLYSVEYPSYAFNPPKWLAAKAKVTKYDSDGKALNMIGILIDITEQKEQQNIIEKQKKELELLAFKDQLTGLNNRLSFYKYIEKETASLLFIDLDGFKQINDANGHNIGDDFLIEKGKCLLDFTDKNSFEVYRLAGDEFVITIDINVDRLAVIELTKTLMKILAQPVKIGELKLSVTSSIGICIYDGTIDMKEVLHQADVAMYIAKRNGKSQYIIANEFSISDVSMV